MKYQEFINNILQTRGRLITSNEYYEKHHIIPRCKNGSDNEENLIDLFAREHFIAHKLLAEENPNDDQLAHAYTLMAFVKDKNQQRYELTPEEYEEARRVYAQNFSGNKNPSSKRVIRLCDNKIYDTVKDCYIDNNVSSSTMSDMLKQHRGFMCYDEWINMSECERQQIQSIDWSIVQHINRSEAAKQRAVGKRNSRCCAVYCIELDEEFWGAKEAELKYGVNRNKISECINGKRKLAGKHPITGELLSWVKLENKNC